MKASLSTPFNGKSFNILHKVYRVVPFTSEQKHWGYLIPGDPKFWNIFSQTSLIKNPKQLKKCRRDHNKHCLKLWMKITVFSLYNRNSLWWDLERDMMFTIGTAWNGFHPAIGNKFEKSWTHRISLIWVTRTLSRNVEMHQICLHAITLERNRPPSNAKLVLNAKWKRDVWLCGCRKLGTKCTNQKPLRNGKSSMQSVGMQPGYSENRHKWLAGDRAGNKAECCGSVVLYSLSVWHRYFLCSQGPILPWLSRPKEGELPWNSMGIQWVLPEIHPVGLGFCLISHHLFWS